MNLKRCTALAFAVPFRVGLSLHSSQVAHQAGAYSGFCSSVLPKNTTQCPWPGLEPGPLAPESSALTMRPPRLSFTLQGAEQKSVSGDNVLFFNVLFTPRGENIFKPHLQNSTWYTIGELFKVSDEHPQHFSLEIPPTDLT